MLWSDPKEGRNIFAISLYEVKISSDALIIDLKNIINFKIFSKDKVRINGMKN